MTDLHQPTRPGWMCQSDGNPWPCATAQKRLRAHYTGDNGAVLLAALHSRLALEFVQAAEDMPHTQAGQLWSRFIGWTRQYAAAEIGSSQAANDWPHAPRNGGHHDPHR